MKSFVIKHTTFIIFISLWLAGVTSRQRFILLHVLECIVHHDMDGNWINLIFGSHSLQQLILRQQPGGEN